MNADIQPISLADTADALLKVLDPRSKDIIVRRFGLKSDKHETLESIGKEYGVTRERVRQIEANAKKALASLNELFAPARELLEGVFKSRGGILAETHVIDLVGQKINGTTNANLVHFYLEIMPQFKYITAEKLFAPHWRHQSSVLPFVDEAVTEVVAILKKLSRPLSTADLLKELPVNLKSNPQVTAETIEAILLASREVAKTAFGEWGLNNWAETSPRGVGDKAYAVLRRHGQPSHFRQITELINTADFDYKKANAQTVHNELIKDRRFVLVGRGLYGLKEWGYMTGTVADVLATILEKSEQPLSRDELIDRVLKQRLVKKNTILLSLQNNNRFRKIDEDRYTLRQTPTAK